MSGTVQLILVTMVKNESKIIARCLESVLGVCDAFCVTDTGSTDKTVDIALDFFEKHNLKGKVYRTVWRNFGESRTESYLNAVDYCANTLHWPQTTTYGLFLDADMVFKYTDKFLCAKQSLNHSGYSMIQSTPTLDYNNTRIMRLDGSWKSVGVTHEFWSGCLGGCIGKNIAYIDDMNDGGCKSDKFERDLRLLVDGIEKDPTNSRYHFYLAQTLKDLGRSKEAIAMYKKRIAFGAWEEEAWYSYYMIFRVYLEQLKDEIRAEAWANRAFQFRKTRAEPLYHLVKHFREKYAGHKALHYYELGRTITFPSDLLFIEKDVYDNLFDYEFTVFYYYLCKNYSDRIFGLRKVVEYLNKYPNKQLNVYSNMFFYIQRCPSTRLINLEFPMSGDFHPSSISVCASKNPTELFCNVRYVNYNIQKLEKEGRWYYQSPQGIIETKNAALVLDFQQILTNTSGIVNFKDIEFMREETIKLPKNTHSVIKGVEDVRLNDLHGRLCYSGTCPEFSYNGKHRILFGTYDIREKAYLENVSLHPPVETNCEKNWIPLPSFPDDDTEIVRFVYNWHPLEIGRLRLGENILKITNTTPTPKIFEHFRGSSNFVVTDDGCLWALTHGVEYVPLRKYYHQFVVVKKGTFELVRYTLPFFFESLLIEYCLGLHYYKGSFFCFFSRLDSRPAVVEIPLANLSELLVHVTPTS